jgi:spore maturation protein A
MEELCKLEEERGNPEYCEKNTKKVKDGERTASNEMCVFLIMNIASLQLIPVNMIAYRSQYGSVSPTAVIAPGLIATFVSALAAIIFCKIMDGTSGRR